MSSAQIVQRIPLSREMNEVTLSSFVDTMSTCASSTVTLFLSTIVIIINSFLISISIFIIHYKSAFVNTFFESFLIFFLGIAGCRFIVLECQSCAIFYGEVERMFDLGLYTIVYGYHTHTRTHIDVYINMHIIVLLQ